jgi:hypothetical protein
MANPNLETRVVPFPMGRLGVNLHSNQLRLLPEEALRTQNCIWKNGMVKRNGTNIVTTTGVSTYSATTISFADADPDTIDDSASGLGNFIAGQQIIVTSTSGTNDGTYIIVTSTSGTNDGTYTIASVAAGTITLVTGDTLTTENAATAGTVTVSVKDGINGLHRFYRPDGAKWLMAATGGVVRYLDGKSWTNVKTGFTSGLQTYFADWGATSRVYVANGTDVAWYWTGTATADVATNLTNVRQFLPYQDRLLAIDENGLGWSGSFDDSTWNTPSSTGVRPDPRLVGMINHSITNSDAGIENQVLLAGSDTMYLFSGTNLDTSTGNYVVYPLAVPTGCNAPRTMVWTPRGSMWLGRDRQIYLLPFNSATPIPVGDKLISTQREVNGIEKIPARRLKEACAVYHDGYYILSIAEPGGLNNTTIWWGEVDRGGVDENGFFGPWYGPMTGMEISCFANLNGFEDLGQLYAGDATKGYVYEYNQNKTPFDIEQSDGTAKSMTVQYKTPFMPVGTEGLANDVHLIESEMLDDPGTITIDFFDTIETEKSGSSVTTASGQVTWGDANWGVNNWWGPGIVRKVTPLSPAIQVRHLSLQYNHASATDGFELYASRVESVEQKQPFQI